VLKRHKLRLGIAIVLVLAITTWLVFVGLGPHEPVYQGRSLSQWLPDKKPPMIEPPGKSIDTNASIAMALFGTNALPCLINWIGYEPPNWANPSKPGSTKLDKLARQFLGPVPKGLTLSTKALYGFYTLGSKAAPAIPQLVRIMKDPRKPFAAERAALALGCIGPDAIQPLLEQFTSTNFVFKRNAANALRFASHRTSPTNFLVAIPYLAAPLRPFQRSNVHEASLWAQITIAKDGVLLGIRASRHPLVMPTLTQFITTNTDPSLLLAALNELRLYAFNPSFSNTIPALLTLTNHPDEQIRLCSIQLLQFIPTRREYPRISTPPVPGVSSLLPTRSPKSPPSAMPLHPPWPKPPLISPPLPSPPAPLPVAPSSPHL
jgi:hypothetical protein